MSLVLAAAAWPTNADLIADAVVPLGYLRPSDHVLDPTWGKGVWWQRWSPGQLTKHDKYTLDGVDFRKLPYEDGTFDAVAYDPPYVSPGGRKTSNIKAMHDRYGMDSRASADAAEDFRTPAELQAIIDAGLAEMFRVVKPRRRKNDGGVVLVKCKDYIWSGELWAGTHETLTYAKSIGFVYVDRFEHVGKPGPQSQRTQVHARRNLSTLLVLRKAK